MRTVARRTLRNASRRNAMSILGVVIGIVFLLPIAWLLITSLTPTGAIGTNPPQLVPASPTGQNYAQAFQRFDFGQFIANSFIVVVPTTVLVVVLGAPASFALARTPIRGRTTILMGLLVISIFPVISLIPPLYAILSAAGWLNSYQALIVPYVAFNLPFAIWIMRNSFAAVPYEIEEAAEMDGASSFRTFVQIVFPQTLPGVFTAATLTFVACWQEFLMALSFNSNARFQTVPVGIALFGGSFVQPWGIIFAASTVALVPIVLVVIALRRFVVGGIAGGAVKG